MATAAKSLLTDLLKQVSRSFYLTLRVLPGPVRSQIGLAYLLARATDTIADTDLIPVDQRLDALARLRERILGVSHPVDFRSIAAAQPAGMEAGRNSEQILLLRIEEAISLLKTFSSFDQKAIQDVLVTIVSGQELDLRRFNSARQPSVAALETDADLDDYTYRVAGCVGEFWTVLCRAHLLADLALDEPLLISNGVRFGKGLQLVNILRDIPKDLQQGRCYLPAERLARVRLKPSDLLDPAREPQLRPVYDELLDQAEGHLRAGWVYTNTLPSTSVRLRLACAWPVLIGVATIHRLRSGNVLDPAQRIKVPRQQVRRILASTLLNYPFRTRWEALFNRRA